MQPICSKDAHQIFSNPKVNNLNQARQNREENSAFQSANSPSVSGDSNSLMSILSLIIQLIQDLSSNTDPSDNPNPLGSASSDNPDFVPFQVPTEKVSIGNITIGEVGDPLDNPELLDNNDKVNINGQQYSIGLLKLEAEHYANSNYIPSIDTTELVQAEWGSGSNSGIKAFEDFISDKYPDGDSIGTLT